MPEKVLLIRVCIIWYEDLHYGRSLHLSSLPEILVTPLSRYVTENWVPRKLDLAVAVPFTIDLAPYYDSSNVASTPEVDTVSVMEVTMQQIMEMGFSRNKAVHALVQTGNLGSEAAMEWLFQHMDDPEVGYTLVENEEDRVLTNIPQESVEILLAAGFTDLQARKALEASGLDVNQAYEYLLMTPGASRTLTFSKLAPSAPKKTSSAHSQLTKYELVAFISHRGPSIHCGHYVAYRKDNNGRWVLCNDVRLVYPKPEMIRDAASKAYIFFYKQMANISF